MADQDRHAALFRDVFTNSLLGNAIFSCLSPADRIRAGRTSHLMRDAVATFHSLAYNINRHLEHFVKDPIALRRLQEKTKFLISGSNALQFLDRTFYPSSDLDIFAYPETAREIGRHLIKEEGYVFEPSPKQAKEFEELVISERIMDRMSRVASANEVAYGGNGMLDLIIFKHPDRDREIQLITCRRAPLDCILYFHSTCVMNIITHDAAYSLYPKATFDERTSLKFGSDMQHSTQVEKAYMKYTDRGWVYIRKLTHQKVNDFSRSFAPDVVRFLDDKYAWKVPLDSRCLSETGSTADESESSSQPIPFDSNSWKLEREFNGYSTKTMKLNMSYHVYHSTFAENTYLVGDVPLFDAFKQLQDYVATHGPRKGLKYIDSFIPALRASHLRTPERIYNDDNSK